MISGRQTLESIDQALRTERAKLSEMEQRIEAASTNRLQLQQADAEDYRALARTRMDLLVDDELVRHLEQAKQQVVALLEARQESQQALTGQLQAAEQARAGLETERKAQAERVDQAAAAIDTAEAATQARLDADPAYQQQRQLATEAERTAMHAAEKAEESEREQDQKGAAYRQDPLFTYLWERQYGTPAYTANPLTRWLDAKVARLIGFADARANYGRLIEIPKRLREHAQTLEAKADAAFEALKTLDTAARESDGIPGIEAGLAGERQALDAIDARIEAADAEHQQLLSEKAAFAAGEDAQSKQAVDYLAAELRREDLMALRREAMRTPFPDDDLIVERLLQRDDERRRLGAAEQGLRDGLEQQRRRLGELESLRVDLKRNGYDRPGSTFQDGALVAMMLGNFLSGMLDRDGLWRILREQQRYQPPRSDPGFGSGSFGRGSVWGGGLGDIGELGDIVAGSLGRSPIRRGGGGRGRGGGFRGGGGRGGFRTGGGF